MSALSVWTLTVIFVTGTGAVAGFGLTGTPGLQEDAIGAPGPYAGPSPETVKRVLGDEGWTPFANFVHDQCGDYSFVFKNPDLRDLDESGNEQLIQAQSTFFIQFQIVGSGAPDTIKKLSFSFGATTDALDDNAFLNCNNAIPENPAGQGTAGAYLLYYRSDFDPEDGIFVPLETRNVPDGEYAAAIHAYDGAGNEVARAWARAVVENCPSEPSGPNQCPNSSADEYRISTDFTQPWPIILPGDGEQSNDVGGLTIEFGEEIQKPSLHVQVNGETVEPEDWEPPERDSDLMPDNDDQDCPVLDDIRFICERKVYGSGFHLDREIQLNDVIRVQARDLNGNLAVKTVHYGASTSKSLVDLSFPEVSLDALNGDTVAMKPGEFHEFNIRLQNIGGDEAHTNLLVNFTQDVGLQANWQTLDGANTNHVVIPAFSEETLKIIARSGSSTPHESFAVIAVAEYDVEGQTQRKELVLDVTIDPNASGSHHGHHGGGLPTSATPTNDTAGPLEEPEGESPGPTFVLVLAGVAMAGIVSVRRRA